MTYEKCGVFHFGGINGSHVALAQHLLVVLVGLAASVGMAT